MKYGLTRRQRDLLEYLQLMADLGRPAPSFDDMAAYMGLKSKSGVGRLLQGLEERGYIQRQKGRARTVAVSEPKASRMRRALQLIRGDGKCEKTVNPVGDCYRSGLTEEAEFLADRVCCACLADRAMKED